jgi:hypothetical protein
MNIVKQTNKTSVRTNRQSSNFNGTSSVHLNRFSHETNKQFNYNSYINVITGSVSIRSVAKTFINIMKSWSKNG